MQSEQIKAPVFGNNLLNNHIQIKAANGWDIRGQVFKVKTALKKKFTTDECHRVMTVPQSGHNNVKSEKQKQFLQERV